VTTEITLASNNNTLHVFQLRQAAALSWQYTMRLLSQHRTRKSNEIFFGLKFTSTIPFKVQ